MLGPPPNLLHLQVARVTEIDLSGRGLSGTIPDLSALNELKVLKLGDNNDLSGSLPAWISSLVSERVQSDSGWKPADSS